MGIKDIGWNLDNSYLNLPDKFFTKVEANPVSLPKLEIINDVLAKELGFNIKELQSQEGIEILAGNKYPEGAASIAQAYVGHQFGYFTMLGDGRAILIGEQISPKGERFDIQLKGSGRTPYSRGGDGRAGLGPMLREYLISESMYNLRIPTTRGLAVVTTGDKIYRESPLPGAILTRVAKSHIRVGSFQFAANFGNIEDIKSIADYSIERHFPNLKNEENPYLALLEEIIKVQGYLISRWQLVGFIHGVMNTDNMTISGETIDYGPCAFMNIYDPSTVFSSIDRNGRYKYENQPDIGGWNLARLAESLLPLIHKDKYKSIKIAEEIIKNYNYIYYNNWLKGMRLKLGILNEEKEDEALINGLLDLMKKYKSDFTNTFVGLTEESFQALERSILFKSEDFKEWNNRWSSRLERQETPLKLYKETMKDNNPIVIPRNHQVERALELAVEKGDYTKFNRLLKVLSTPYNYNEVYEEYMLGPEPSKTPYKTYCGT